MEFIGAFIVAGLLCVACQIALERKVSVPTILIVGFALGSLMVPMDWAAKLVELGGAGMITTIIDAGEGVFYGWTALMDGEPLRFITFFLALGVVSLFGVIGGMGHYALKKDK